MPAVAQRTVRLLIVMIRDVWVIDKRMIWNYGGGFAAIG